jgi:hypothetical protein
MVFENALPSGFSSAPSNFGSLAMFAVMRRASSRVSSLPVVRLPGSSSQYTNANTCLLLSRTMKHGWVSSTVQGSGKRRAVISLGNRRLPTPAPAATTHRFQAGLSRPRPPLRSQSRRAAYQRIIGAPQPGGARRVPMCLGVEQRNDRQGLRWGSR